MKTRVVKGRGYSTHLLEVDSHREPGLVVKQWLRIATTKWTRSRVIGVRGEAYTFPPIRTVLIWDLPFKERWGIWLGGLQEAFMATFIKAAIAKAAGERGKASPVDKAFSKEYPAIWEFLTEDSIDKVPRTRSSVSVFVEGASWKVSLAEKDLEQSLYCSGGTLEEALQALEAGLTGPNPDWRSWKGGRAKGGVRKRD